MILDKMIGADKNFIKTTVPQMFFFDLTESCNLRCWFCYASKFPHIAHGNLEVSTKIINIMSDAGCKEVIYLGGEPTIVPYFFDVLMYADSIGMKQCVITNGQLIDDEFANRLSTIHNLEVGISIHSCYPKVHDEMSGVKGAFKKVINSIISLEKAGIKWYSQTSLVKSNYLEMNNLSIFLQSMGHPMRMDLSRMVPNTQYDDMFLNESGYIEVFRQINSMDLTMLPVRIEAFPRCWLKKISREYNMSYQKLRSTVRPCYAWVGQVSINVVGDVRLCPTGGVTAGNVIKDGIFKIWNEDGKIREFQTFNWLPEQCRSCDDFSYCVGACKMTHGTIIPLPDKYILKGD